MLPFWGPEEGDAGKDTACPKLSQLETLSNSRTVILTALIWPILSMLFDYLFPKGEPPSTDPGTPLSTL
jgi:hypothetical protein